MFNFIIYIFTIYLIINFILRGKIYNQITKKILYLYIFNLPFLYGNIAATNIKSRLFFSLLLFLSFFLEIIFNKIKIKKKHFLVYFVFIFCIIIFNYFFALDKNLYFENLLYLSFNLIIIFIIINSLEYKDIHFVINILLILGLYESILGISQSIWNQNVFIPPFFREPLFKGYIVGTFARGSGTFYDPNRFSVFLIMLVPIIFEKIRKKKHVFIYFCLLIIYIMGIFFSFSRMALLILFFYLFVLFMKDVKEINIKEIFYISLLFFFSFFIIDKINIFQRFDIEKLTSDYRITIIKNFLENLGNINIFTGIGLGNFSFASNEIFDLGVNVSAHNEFIQLLSEFGIIVFIIILYFLFRIFITLYKKYDEYDLLLSLFGVVISANFLIIREIDAIYILIGIIIIIITNSQPKVKNKKTVKN